MTRRRFLRTAGFALGAAGLWLPKAAHGAAATYITNRVVNSSGDKRIFGKFSSSPYISRKFNLGTWASLNIGVRFVCSGSADLTGTPDFEIGIANAYGDQIAATCASASWPYVAAAGGDYAYFNVGLQKVKWHLDGVYSFGSGNATVFPADVSVGARRCLYLHVVKGSPNWSVSIYGPTNANLTVDNSRDEFLAGMVQQTPNPTGAAARDNMTAPFDENNGALDTAYIYASGTGTASFEICDFAVAKTS